MTFQRFMDERLAALTVRVFVPKSLVPYLDLRRIHDLPPNISTSDIPLRFLNVVPVAEITTVSFPSVRRGFTYGIGWQVPGFDGWESAEGQDDVP